MLCFPSFPFSLLLAYFVFSVLQMMQAKNGSGVAFQYNMKGRSGVRYLIQQIWDRSKQICMSQRGPR